jgi:hypothetical protein
MHGAGKPGADWQHRRIGVHAEVLLRLDVVEWQAGVTVPTRGSQHNWCQKATAVRRRRAEARHRRREKSRGTLGRICRGSLAYAAPE